MVMSRFSEPRILVCVECKEEFVFTAAAQEYFDDKGFYQDPKRCKSCHLARKRRQRNGETESTGTEVPVDVGSSE